MMGQIFSRLRFRVKQKSREVFFGRAPHEAEACQKTGRTSLHEHANEAKNLPKQFLVFLLQGSRFALQVLAAQRDKRVCGLSAAIAHAGVIHTNLISLKLLLSSLIYFNQPLRIDL
ncbi:MAG: hypothetical protein PSX36_07015 [bacterium]|nr:hypothetical protein [bacterium]